MGAVQEFTRKLLASKSGAPFLFVGSGFSRRYLGADDWVSLLTRFCEEIEDFEYYRTSANGDLPTAASLIAKDFHEIWWKGEKYANSRKEMKGMGDDVSSALKNEIAKYIEGLDLTGLPDDQIQSELNILRSLNVDGIITTNWDLLLEEVFPEYRVFVGQEELLFSNPQAVAEIYKIHGCCSNPKSMVLTGDDYNKFSEKNPYLAAKIITLFIEHPIFFIGYSLTDSHIQGIIFSIASCLGADKLDQFSENLVFVRRANGDADEVQKFTFSEGGRNITTTVLSTDDFTQVYTAIDENKRKIPARILRYCKEQMYELVQSAQPEKKLAVLDIDELEASDEVEFVVGVGVAAGHNQQQADIEADGAEMLSKFGYKGISIPDLFSDVVADASKYEADLLLEHAFPLLARTNSTYIPVYRYLNQVGIDSAAKLAESEYESAKKVVAKMGAKTFYTKQAFAHYQSHWKGVPTAEIIERAKLEKVATLIVCQSSKEVDLDAVGDFIRENLDTEFRDPYSTYFRKLICYYDKVKFGF